VWDGFCGGVFGADIGHAGVGGFTGFGKSVVAAVKVFAFLELVLEEIFLVGQLAVEAEEALLIAREGIDVDLVLLVRIHLDWRGSSGRAQL